MDSGFDLAADMKPYLADMADETEATANPQLGLVPVGYGHDDLNHRLQQLGLRTYEARVLLALLAAGRATTSAELAAHSGVPRTSIYEVMKNLTEQGLAAVVPTLGPTAWATPGWATVLDILDAVEADSLHQHQLATTELRQALANELSPTEPA